jgi:4'-phosphopantetheinyl transferase
MSAVAPGLAGDLSLPPGEVHVWRVDLDVPAARRAALASLLDRHERARAMRLRQPVDRDRWVVARGSLRCVLAAYTGAAPGALVLAIGPHGKPYLLEAGGPAPLRFNVSHADGVALIAVAWRREVGIDVERERADRADLDVARRMFSADEADTLAALPAEARVHAFFSVWATREAYAKAIGLGLEAMSATPPAGWTLRDLPVGPGYTAAVAVELGAEVVRCRPWPAAIAVHQSSR